MNTTITQIANGINNFYDRVLLERAVASFIQTRFAQVRDIPMNNTSTIKFRRYTNLSAATTALVEGVTPSGSQLAVTDITASVSQYGDFITLTDFLQMQTLDPIMTETSELLGDEAGDTLDQLTATVLVAGTTVQYANGRTSRATVASTDKMTLTEARLAVRTLKQNKAKRITSMIDPTTGYNTTPVNAAFIGFVHPNTTYDLKGATGFVQIQAYPDPKQALPDEVGALDEIRFLESTNCKLFAAAGSGGIDVYATMVLAANAYGITRISGEAMKNIIKPLGSGGTSDPLDQRSTMGWKATFVAVRLNETFMVRIEHAVSS